MAVLKRAIRRDAELAEQHRGGQKPVKPAYIKLTSPMMPASDSTARSIVIGGCPFRQIRM
jgi:hypothetical protein